MQEKNISYGCSVWTEISVSWDQCFTSLMNEPGDGNVPNCRETNSVVAIFCVCSIH